MIIDFLTDPATGGICLAYGALVLWAYHGNWRHRFRRWRRHAAWLREPFANG